MALVNGINNNNSEILSKNSNFNILVGGISNVAFVSQRETSLIPNNGP